MWRRLFDKIVPYKDLISDGVSAVSVVAAVVVGLIPYWKSDIVKPILVGLFIVVIIVLAIFRRTSHMSRPEEKSVYFIDLPCTPAELDAAIDIAQHYFGRDSMKPDIVRAAYLKNPFSFIVIKDSAGKVLGYFDHFGLQVADFDTFLGGGLPENSMSAETFVRGEDIVDAKRLYIGGIAIKPKSLFERGKITKCLLWAGCELLLKRYMAGDEEFSLYATGYSREGREMLNSLGFGKLSEGTERHDKSPLYWRTLTRKAVLRYRQNNPVCKSELVLKFHREPRAFQQVTTTLKTKRATGARVKTNTAI